MQAQITVYLIDVSQGKNKNWLTFNAYVDALDKNKKYALNFCGTELEHSLALPEREIEELTNMMCADFGYAPYDLEMAKRVLQKGKSYVLIRGKTEK